MTLVLAVESATDAAGVALADEDGLLASVRVGRGRRHTESIAPAVQAVCRSGGVGLDRVDAVAVDIGPGLFTGLRVGIATAKGLATGLGVPMMAVGSLELLAAGVTGAGLLAPRSGGPDVVVACVDARRHEVFWACFDMAEPFWPMPVTPMAVTPMAVTPMPVTPMAQTTAQAGKVGRAVGVPVAEPGAHVDVPSALAGALGAMVGSGGPASSGGVLLVGDGASRYADELVQPGVMVAARTLAFPSAEVLATIGVARAAAGLGVDPGSVTAVYLRDADARINWQQRTEADPATVGGRGSGDGLGRKRGGGDG